jgi:hypothetical protein
MDKRYQKITAKKNTYYHKNNWLGVNKYYVANIRTP